MYLDYLKNCKFTSPTTLPLINFMQRSLVEVYSLNLIVTYQHGFTFLRQLVIYLRTAIQNRKQVNIEVVRCRFTRKISYAGEYSQSV